MQNAAPPDDNPPPAPEEAPPPARAGLGVLSLLASISGVMSGGYILAARALPYLGCDLDRQPGGAGEIVALLTGFVVLTVFLVYLSVIVWMLVARLFVPRETIYAIMTSGPTWRFDHWLFNLICPDDKAR